MRLFWKMGVRVCRVIGLYFSLSPRRGLRVWLVFAGVDGWDFLSGKTGMDGVGLSFCLSVDLGIVDSYSLDWGLTG